MDTENGKPIGIMETYGRYETDRDDISGQKPEVLQARSGASGAQLLARGDTGRG